MKLVKIKSRGLVLPLTFPQAIHKEKLEYFIYGEGYKRTRNFEILPDEIPCKWDIGNFLNVARYGDKYGLEVATYLADALTAGIVAKQTARGAIRKWRAIKEIDPEFNDPVFFDALKMEYTLSCFGVDFLDINGTDKALAELDPDYNPENCTWLKNGKIRRPVSMRQYITMKYGPLYSQIIESLINQNT